MWEQQFFPISIFPDYRQSAFKSVIQNPQSIDSAFRIPHSEFRIRETLNPPSPP
jgi:hypothetical protein